MERVQVSEERSQRQLPEAEVDGYDAAPRDDPAVFVADSRALDGGHGVVGAWIRLDQPAGVIHEQLRDLMGDEPEHWAVVDQVGLETMVDEDATLEWLQAVPRE